MKINMTRVEDSCHVDGGSEDGNIRHDIIPKVDNANMVTQNDKGCKVQSEANQWSWSVFEDSKKESIPVLERDNNSLSSSLLPQQNNTVSLDLSSQVNAELSQSTTTEYIAPTLQSSPSTTNSRTKAGGNSNSKLLLNQLDSDIATLHERSDILLLQEAGLMNSSYYQTVAQDLDDMNSCLLDASYGDDSRDAGDHESGVISHNLNSSNHISFEEAVHASIDVTELRTIQHQVDARIKRQRCCKLLMLMIFVGLLHRYAYNHFF